MTIDKNPLSPILIRFQQDLEFNGLSERSQESYCRAVRKFSEFLKREPDTASEDDLRNYLLFIKNDLHWAASTINVAQQGIKKFFKITCPQTWATLKLLRVRGELKLPVVISIGEVHTFLKLIEKPSMLCFFTVVYTLGLRLQEALNLQVADIDSKRMLVHVHRGKGAKDRLIPLPEPTLLVLRKYYKTHRNKEWIFPTDALFVLRGRTVLNWKKRGYAACDQRKRHYDQGSSVKDDDPLIAWRCWLARKWS